MPFGLKIKTLKFLFKITLLFSIVSLAYAIENKAIAQDKKQIVQFSGVIVGEDSTSGVPGVHIYVPKAGRGTTSNIYGYFSMAVLAGDSVVISAIGYSKQSLIIPHTKNEKYTVIVELTADTTYLPSVEIFPFPTEEEFKAAILALQLPNEGDFRNMKNNLDPDLLARMFENMPMDGSMNHRNYIINNQILQINDRFGPRPNQLLNPFAWSEFIRSIKKGELKNKD
jgi:hypothetical protein